MKGLQVHVPSPDNDEWQLIGAITFDGKAHEFTVFDLRLVPDAAVRECHEEIQQDRVRGGFRLLAEMYAQCFRYEDSNE